MREFKLFLFKQIPRNDRLVTERFVAEPSTWCGETKRHQTIASHYTELQLHNYITITITLPTAKSFGAGGPPQKTKGVCHNASEGRRHSRGASIIEIGAACGTFICTVSLESSDTRRWGRHPA